MDRNDFNDFADDQPSLEEFINNQPAAGALPDPQAVPASLSASPPPPQPNTGPDALRRWEEFDRSRAAHRPPAERAASGAEASLVIAPTQQR